MASNQPIRCHASKLSWLIAYFGLRATKPTANAPSLQDWAHGRALTLSYGTRHLLQPQELAWWIVLSDELGQVTSCNPPAKPIAFFRQICNNIDTPGDIYNDSHHVLGFQIRSTVVHSFRASSNGNLSMWITSMQIRILLGTSSDYSFFWAMVEIFRPMLWRMTLFLYGEGWIIVMSLERVVY